MLSDEAAECGGPKQVLNNIVKEKYDIFVRVERKNFGIVDIWAGWMKRRPNKSSCGHNAEDKRKRTVSKK